MINNDVEVPLVLPLELGIIFSKLVSFLSGAEKSISDIGAKGTRLNDGGSQEQGIDVHDIHFLACTLASRVKELLQCENKLPPAHGIQLQCAHITVSLYSVPIQALARGTESLCECLTWAVTR